MMGCSQSDERERSADSSIQMQELLRTLQTADMELSPSLLTEVCQQQGYNLSHAQANAIMVEAFADWLRKEPTLQEHVESIFVALEKHVPSQAMWGCIAKDTPRIANISDRGITVSQLRILSQFVVSLCKTRLLKHTSSRAHEDGRVGKCIHWRDVNLYDITDEVIKKVILHAKPTMLPERLSAGQQWCSWVEFVASHPQPAKIMFSHWWGGCFRDTMDMVNMLAKDKGLCASTAIWICTFANNQFGEAFGTRIMDTPFVKAVANAELTVLLVDRSAGSLSRTWCALELYRTAASSKDLEVYTPLGKVGAGRASSGPLIESVKAFDIRITEASDDSYRRQILNYIAHEDEALGLQREENGTIRLVDGRPALEDMREEKEVRMSGKPELSYESELFKKHAKEFEAVNMKVRMEVYSSVGKHTRPKGCRIEEECYRAVSLGQWRALCRDIASSYKHWKPSQEEYNAYRDGNGLETKPLPPQAVDMNLYELDKYYLGPRRDNEGRSIMEALSSGPQLSQTYVNLAFTMNLGYVMSAIDYYAEARQLPDSWMFYIEVLAWDGKPKEERANGYATAIDLMKECDSMLAIMDSGLSSVNRLWRLFEFELASRCSLGMYMSCSTGVIACNRPFPDRYWVFGDFDPGIARLLQNIDVSTAHIVNGRDREVFQAFFKSSLAAERLQRRLSLWGAGPVLHDAISRNDVAGIKKVFSAGLTINSPSLLGSHGESALHVACVSGSLQVLEQLLQLKADPNAEDESRATPLHYAAMAGHTEAAKLLIEARADIMHESCDTMTPFEIAATNPAAFLHISTTEVSKLLAPAVPAAEIQT
eukprot:TRINITY_DN9948_c0_g1_i4.p1 TRINITY_DN9948_c0_g1~~TRINITY_DN9948_c0_g1_i4.p1  ORF type:complete len:824 (-),score=147.49 TRINITY_DN9948_c0_g1_i4:137-2608(-)